jgi:hypothetical protein
MNKLKIYYTDLAQKLKNFQFSKTFYVFLIIAITYRISLDFYYITAVSPQYDYGGLDLNPNGIKYLISWIIYLLVFITIPKIENSIPSFFLNLQFIVMFAPMTSIYSLKNCSTLYLLMISFVIIMQVFILKPNNNTPITISLFNLDKYTTTFMIIFIPAILIIAVLWGGFYGLAAFNLTFLNEIRQNANYPLVLSYLLCWLPDAIIPFYLAYALSKKKYFLAGCLVFIDILLYMVLGQKFIYLSLIVILAVFVVSKTKHLIKLMYLGFSGICLTTTVLYILESFSESRIFSETMNSFLGIRFLFSPALNKFIYYDFFSQYPKVFFSDGLIGKLLGFTNIYNGSNGQTIYAYLTGDQLYTSNSNTGYFGDSYAQFGVFGLLIMSIILAYIIKFISSNSNGLNYSLIVSVISIEIIILNDGAILTTLLSNGLAIIIILLLIYSKPKGKTYFRRNIK